MAHLLISEHILYANPEANEGNRIRPNVFDDRAVTIDYETFINGMIKAVREWREKVIDSENYQNNVKDLLQIRPLSPFNFFSGDLAVY